MATFNIHDYISGADNILYEGTSIYRSGSEEVEQPIILTDDGLWLTIGRERGATFVRADKINTVCCEYGLLLWSVNIGVNGGIIELEFEEKPAKEFFRAVLALLNGSEASLKAE